ncbi:hypothetical protein RYX36_008581, partial [Vicia faba]
MILRYGLEHGSKIFVGGLAWKTKTDTLKSYFDQFGEILEVIVIIDRTTGKSKGYGFDPNSAIIACQNPNPVIDGRRTNCNLAFQKSNPSSSTSTELQGILLSIIHQLVPPKTSSSHYLKAVLIGAVATLHLALTITLLLLWIRSMSKKGRAVSKYTEKSRSKLIHQQYMLSNLKAASEAARSLLLLLLCRWLKTNNKKKITRLMLLESPQYRAVVRKP